MRKEESALLETAKTAERSGNYAIAFDSWQQLASLTNRPDYLCKLGRAANKLGRWTDAENAFLDAIKVDETFSLAMVFLGSLFLARTDREPPINARTAKAWLEQAVAAAPSAMSLSLLGPRTIDLERKKPPLKYSAKRSSSMKPMRRHILTLGFFWRTPATTRSRKSFLE